MCRSGWQIGTTGDTMLVLLNVTQPDPSQAFIVSCVAARCIAVKTSFALLPEEQATRMPEETSLGFVVLPACRDFGVPYYDEEKHYDIGT